MHRRPTFVTRRALQRGAVLPLVAIGLLAIVGIAGLSIDVGHAFLNKTRLQNSLDSAALSGARTLLLTDDVDAAGADARAAFREHLGGEMAGLGTEDLVLEYSDTLVPFVDGGSAPRYVRAAFERFATGMFFAGVLDGVGRSMDIAGTAVAGPVPLGYPGAAETCDVAPLLVCGAVGDDDCTDGSCFGYRVGGRTEYELRLVAGVDTAPPATAAAASAQGFASASLEVPACGEGSAYPGCVPAPDGVGEPGHFLLHALGCTGERCVGEALAGSLDACLTDGARAGVQNLAAPGPLVRGLMTRLGVSDPSLAPSDYPPDVVTTDRTADVGYWYDRYRRDVASLVAAGSDGDGVPFRRVLTVPVANCTDAALGTEANTVLGFLCLFLTRVVDEAGAGGAIYGQFVERCEASGSQGASVPAMSDVYDGPLEIVLYKDPGALDS